MKNNKLTWKRFFQSHLFFVLGIIVLLLLSISLGRAQLQDRTIRNEISKLYAEVDTLEQEREQYKELITLLDTPAFLEKEARKSLGYVNPGEKVVVIEKNQQGQQDQQDQQNISNPMKWWIYFFGS